MQVEKWSTPLKSSSMARCPGISKKDLSKLRGRELYIVVKLADDDDDWCWIKKSVRQLRIENYKVKKSEIRLAPNQIIPDDLDKSEKLKLHENHISDCRLMRRKVKKI